MHRTQSATRVRHSVRRYLWEGLHLTKHPFYQPEYQFHEEHLNVYVDLALRVSLLTTAGGPALVSRRSMYARLGLKSFLRHNRYTPYRGMI